METDKLIQVFFEDLMFFVDLTSNTVYSAKLKPLKGQRLKRHNFPHFMIKYNGKKRYLSLDTILRLANEKLQRETKQVL